VAVLFLLQVAVAHRFFYSSVRFDLLYLIAVFIALEAGVRDALWSALWIGLLRDLASVGRLGSSAVLLVLAAAGVLLIRDRVFRESAVMDAAFVFAVVFLCALCDAVWLGLAGHEAAWGTLAGRATGQAAVTAALSPVFFVFFEWIGLVERPGLRQP